MSLFKNEDDLCEYFTSRGKIVPAHFTGNYYSAIIKVKNGKLVYSFDKMIEEIMEEDHCSEEDAIEWVEYNAIRTIPYMGDTRPEIKR